jgi:hypothetical protein
LWHRIHAPGAAVASRTGARHRRIAARVQPAATYLCPLCLQSCVPLRSPACLCTRSMPACRGAGVQPSASASSRSRSMPLRAACLCRSRSTPPRLCPKPPARPCPVGSRPGAQLLLLPAEGLAPSSNLPLFFMCMLRKSQFALSLASPFRFVVCAGYFA